MKYPKGDPDDGFGLIVVSAPSGAGKSSLCIRLLERLKDRLALSISTTSRSPRGSERHGVEYFFVSPEEFDQKIRNHEFAEWANVHGNYYGTSKETLARFWADRKHVLLDIDVQGASALFHGFPARTLTVFIAPPSLEILEQRLRGRGTDSEESVQKRMKNAVSEMGRKEEFHRVILNDDFEKAYAELEAEAIRFMDALEGGTWQSPA
ncbi:MAG: guanylate kinase [Bdellovibrionales bacterium]|nr:guanylate kinase [Bdellovibrionales bacterium]